jgi:hypothetical protein
MSNANQAPAHEQTRFHAFHIAYSALLYLRDDYRNNRLPGESNYFTKVQDYDENEWLHHMVLHPTIVPGEVAVIPVTFGAKEKNGCDCLCEKRGWTLENHQGRRY